MSVALPWSGGIFFFHFFFMLLERVHCNYSVLECQLWISFACGCVSFKRCSIAIEPVLSRFSLRQVPFCHSIDALFEARSFVF